MPNEAPPPVALIRMPGVENFATQLMNAAGLSHTLPDDMREVFKEGLMDQITERMGVLVMQELKEESLEDYLKLLKETPAPSPDALEDFFKTNIPDYQT